MRFGKRRTPAEGPVAFFVFRRLLMHPDDVTPPQPSREMDGPPPAPPPAPPTVGAAGGGLPPIRRCVEKDEGGREVVRYRTHKGHLGKAGATPEEAAAIAGRAAAKNRQPRPPGRTRRYKLDL